MKELLETLVELDRVVKKNGFAEDNGEKMEQVAVLAPAAP